jgi:hypothetical protein
VHIGVPRILLTCIEGKMYEKVEEWMGADRYGENKKIEMRIDRKNTNGCIPVGNRNRYLLSIDQ